MPDSLMIARYAVVLIVVTALPLWCRIADPAACRDGE